MYIRFRPGTPTITTILVMIAVKEHEIHLGNNDETMEKIYSNYDKQYQHHANNNLYA